MSPRPAPPTAVLAALERWRAYVHPGQLVPESTCPLCGDPSAPTWPEGDLRRCAELVVDLCRVHRERVLAEQLRRDLDVRAALALVRSRVPSPTATGASPEASGDAENSTRVDTDSNEDSRAIRAPVPSEIPAQGSTPDAPPDEAPSATAPARKPRPRPTKRGPGRPPGTHTQGARLLGIFLRLHEAARPILRARLARDLGITTRSVSRDLAAIDAAMVGTGWQLVRRVDGKGRHRLSVERVKGGTR